MQIGMMGLGRMGAGMVRRLMRGGHACVVYDVNPDATARLASEGATGAPSIEGFVAALRKPRVIWMMVPAAHVEAAVAALTPHLERDDVLVDGGNSRYLDDLRRAALLRANGIHYVDVGTSGGVWGFERGYCLMIGGDPEPVARLEPLFVTLAPPMASAARTPGREAGAGGTAEHGYLHCGPSGAGHFVKMIHNGIEYGLMAAYAEGLNILRAKAGYDFNLADITEVWRRGSVITSWLLDLAASALLADPALQQFAGHVADSGEGRWTIQAAIDEGVPAPVLSAALYERFSSRGQAGFANKVLSAMRYQFGGHEENAGGQ
jgi:6-phosphogluconate dehydrogenase